MFDSKNPSRKSQSPRLIVFLVGISALFLGACNQAGEVTRDHAANDQNDLALGLSTAAPIYEAEKAVLSGAVVANNHAGYTGTGFVNYVNATGDYVEWSVDVAAAGSFDLGFRYANGSSTRNLKVTVNGAVVNVALGFAGTGTWDSWKSAIQTVSLKTGVNKIRLTAIGSSGPNLDNLQVTPKSNPIAGGGGSGSTALTQCLNADGPGGKDAYTLLESVLGKTPFDLPDADHSPAFHHIQEGSDDQVGNYFTFYLHRDIDKDGASTDRQRAEIKVYNPSPDSLKGMHGSTFTYTWRFKLNPGLTFSGGFTHFFQLKAVGGDDGSPLITITGEKKSGIDMLEVRYMSSTTSSVLAHSTWAGLRDQWLQVRVQATFSETGTVSLQLKKADGTIVVSAVKTNIDMWRSGASFVRPKWGFYRSLEDKSHLRPDEETVRFANFAITRGTTPGTDCRGNF